MRRRKSSGSCSILKKRIKTAHTKTARGKALGAAMRAKCFRRHKRSRR